MSTHISFDKDQVKRGIEKLERIFKNRDKDGISPTKEECLQLMYMCRQQGLLVGEPPEDYDARVEWYDNASKHLDRTIEEDLKY